MCPVDQSDLKDLYIERLEREKRWGSIDVLGTLTTRTEVRGKCRGGRRFSR